MNKLKPIHPQREKVYKKFMDLLQKHNINNINDIEKMSLNIERGIFNLSLLSYGSDGIWNDKFNIRYINKVVKIYINLDPDSYIKNKNLLKRLFLKEFNEFDLVNLSQKDIFPERYLEICNTFKFNNRL